MSLKAVKRHEPQHHPETPRFSGSSGKSESAASAVTINHLVCQAAVETESLQIILLIIYP